MALFTGEDMVEDTKELKECINKKLSSTLSLSTFSKISYQDILSTSRLAS